MFGIIAWVARVLLIVWVLRLILSMLFPTRRPQAGRPPGGPGGPRRPPAGERAGGQLVRDPQCGTYVAESAAVSLSHGGATLFFCSDACRDAYAAAHA